MKSCPKCHSKYSDNTLSFCLQDGAELVAEQISETEFPTVAFGEKTERFTSNKDVDQIRFDLQANEPPSWDQSRETKLAVPQNVEKKYSALIVVLWTVLGTLILFGGIGISLWFFLLKIPEPNVGDTNRNSIPGNSANRDAIQTPDSKPSKNAGKLIILRILQKRRKLILAK